MANESIFVKIEAAFDEFLKKFQKMIKEAEKSAKIKVDVSSNASRSTGEIRDSLNETERQARRVRSELGGVQEDFEDLAGLPISLQYGLRRIAGEVARTFPAEKMDLVRIMNIPGINDQMPRLLNSLRTKAKIMEEIAKLAKNAGYAPGAAAAERLAKSSAGETLVDKGKKEFRDGAGDDAVENAIDRFRSSLGRGSDDLVGALAGGGSRVVRALSELGSGAKKGSDEFNKAVSQAGAGLARIGFTMQNVAMNMLELRKASSRMAVEMTGASGGFMRDIEKTIATGGDLRAVMMGNTEASRQSQKAFTEAAISVGKTPEQFQQLANSLRKSGMTVGGALIDPLSKGGQDLMVRLSTIGRTVGLTDEQMAGYATSLSQMKGKSFDATRSFAMLRDTADFANLDIGALTDTMTEMADSISAFGGDVDETTSAFGALVRINQEYGMTQKAAMARTREQMEAAKNATLSQRFMATTVMQGTEELKNMKELIAKKRGVSVESVSDFDVSAFSGILAKAGEPVALAYQDAMISNVAKMYRPEVAMAFADKLASIFGTTTELMETRIARAANILPRETKDGGPAKSLNEMRDQIKGASEGTSAALEKITNPADEFAKQAQEAATHLMAINERLAAEATRNALTAMSPESMNAAKWVEEAGIKLSRVIADLAGRLDTLIPGFTGVGGGLLGLAGTALNVAGNLASISTAVGGVAGARAALAALLSGAGRAALGLIGPAGLVVATGLAAMKMHEAWDEWNKKGEAEKEAADIEKYQGLRDDAGQRRFAGERDKLRESASGLDSEGQKEFSKLREAAEQGMKDAWMRKQTDEAAGITSNVSMEQEAGKWIRALRKGLEDISTKRKGRSGDPDITKLESGSEDFKAQIAKLKDPGNTEEVMKQLAEAQRLAGSPDASITKSSDKSVAEKMVKSSESFSKISESIQGSTESMKAFTANISQSAETFKSSTTEMSQKAKEESSKDSHLKEVLAQIAERKERAKIEAMPTDTVEQSWAKRDAEKLLEAKILERTVGGYDFTKDVKEDISLRNERQKSYDSGVQQFIGKPYDPAAMAKFEKEQRELHEARTLQNQVGGSDFVKDAESRIQERNERERIERMPETTTHQKQEKRDAMSIFEAQMIDRLVKASSVATSSTLESVSSTSEKSKNSRKIELTMPTTINVGSDATVDDYMNELIPVLKKSIAEIINRMHNEKNVAGPSGGSG